MESDFEQPDGFFYLGWVMLSALAILLAFGGTFVVLGLAVDWIGDWIIVNGERRITEDYLFSFVFPPLIWFFTSGLQYALLRRHLPKMGWWILTTGAGWLFMVGLFYLAIQFLDRNNLTATTNTAVFAVVGAAIGLLQWMLLRRRLSRAAWWIAASAIGWGLIGLTVGPTFTNPFEIMLLGFFPSLTTALCWWYLFSQPQKTEPIRI